MMIMSTNQFSDKPLDDLDPLTHNRIEIKSCEAASLKLKAAATDCESTRWLLLAKSNLAFLESVRIEDLARSSLGFQQNFKQT
ncbi:hypothetical protein [Shewanella sp. YLB-07]|uniref:hypothetical protein n=1 Tax=Shewanella sp. YLB-07 TaxID=2601268 RepID=UPI00128C6720|nr:hypothetical protein [Shewanella sp. YLB-07]MPY24329.1 hypothetical protein [Shewanella sp. YLB-07]